MLIPNHRASPVTPAGPELPLLTSALEYHLPGELIARYPAAERDASRLLVVEKDKGTWHHLRFRELADWLRPGDTVVLNRTRVRQARTFGQRSTGARIELLWLHQDHDTWRALARPAARLRPGETLTLEHGLQVVLLAKEADGVVQLRVPDGVDMEAHLAAHGHVPLPPYLNRGDEPLDRERYQTVFAREPGAVAAPTAGLHFTSGTLSVLRERGVAVAELLLHVGPGTFRPVQTHTVQEHRIDPEWYFVPGDTWSLMEAGRASGGRIVAVGTTVVRALETAAALRDAAADRQGWSTLLIAPPYRFRCVDALLTNFHLPSSSLLALVAAFAGLELTLAAYRAAVEERYRFYSYGDAMLIV